MERGRKGEEKGGGGEREGRKGGREDNLNIHTQTLTSSPLAVDEEYNDCSSSSPSEGSSSGATSQQSLIQLGREGAIFTNSSIIIYFSCPRFCKVCCCCCK